MKLTMLAIMLLVLVGTAMCQEPLNHAVSQPVAQQHYAVQPFSPNVPVTQQPAAAIPYFTFQPLAGIPPVSTPHATEARVLVQPVLTPKLPLAQPAASNVPHTCGCGK